MHSRINRFLFRKYCTAQSSGRYLYRIDLVARWATTDTRLYLFSRVYVPRERGARQIQNVTSDTHMHDAPGLLIAL